MSHHYSSSSSRYKISNPRPAGDDGGYSRGYGGRTDSGYGGRTDSGYGTSPSASTSALAAGMSRLGVSDGSGNYGHSREQSQGYGSGYGQSQSQSYSRSNRSPQPPSAHLPQVSYSSHVTQPSLSQSPSQGSPTRPARSARRPESSADRLGIGLNTRDLGRNNGDEIVTPITPIDEGEGAAMALGNAGDPWAADRAARSQARQGTMDSAKAAHARSPAGGQDKLRGIAAAFMAAGKESRDREQESVRRPPRRRQAQQPKKDTWDDIGTGVGGGKFAEIDAVMRTIKKDWPFVMDGDFTPSSLALALLTNQPSASLPSHPDLYAFNDVHNALSGSLQKAVQGHFQTFAASLPTHANFVATLERAQAQVKSSREALKEAREGISGQRKAELASVRARERMVREMLQVLDLVDEVRQVPEQLEACIAEKRFLQAALLLVHSKKTINREDLQDVGALSDLRQYLQSQEGTLVDICVEELHNHLYLKTFNNEARWRAYVPGQQSLPVIDEISDTIPTKQANGTDGSTSRFSSYLSSLAVKPNHEPILNDLAPRTAGRSSANMTRSTSVTSISSIYVDNSNGELDSFAYMETLIEALAALGKLGSALDTIVQRVPTEIHSLIETTMDEVEERAHQRDEEFMAVSKPQSLMLAEKHDLESMPLFDNDTLRVVVSLESSGPPKHAVILRDLFWTLYSKLVAVLEGHRAVYEVAKWISSRRDFKSSSKTDAPLNVPVLEIWRPVQQEVRSLLQAYLNDESQGAAGSLNAIPSINEVLREGRLVRDKQRELFKFGDTDMRGVNSEIKEIDDGLKQTLRASVPGLINLQAGDNVNVLSGNSAAEDRYANNTRRTLIPANPFNVTVLFQPTLSLIKRTTSIVPPGFEDEMSQFGSVLEEFVQNVFLPQLDEKVTASFQYAVSGYDAFQLDRRPSLGLEKAPLKSSMRVMALIQSLCAMLQETPFHRENYSRLVIGVVVQYYQQCNSRFKDLVTVKEADGTPGTALPAIWAQREDMIAALAQLRSAKETADTERRASKETKLELALLDGKWPLESQLLYSTRRLEAIGHLATSMRWFLDELMELQELVDDDALENPQALPMDRSRGPRLPLTRAMADRFSTIVQTYEQLIHFAMNTLHLEVRCRVLCNLGASLQRGDYRLESEAFEPDPDVVDLNTSLMELDSIGRRTLAAADQGFMFRGLATLMNHMFIHAARTIKGANAPGVRKMRRNILSLQQTLRGIMTAAPDSEAQLLRAAEFWDLFELGPQGMLADIRRTKPVFAFDDYNAMLALQCPADGDDADAELNMYGIDLHAIAMEYDMDT